MSDEGEATIVDHSFERDGYTYDVVDIPKSLPFRVNRWVGEVVGLEGLALVVISVILYLPFHYLAPVKVAVIRYKPRWFSKTEILYQEQHRRRTDVDERLSELSELLQSRGIDPDAFAASAPATVMRITKSSRAKQNLDGGQSARAEQTDWTVNRGGLRFEVVESAMGFPLNFAGTRQRGSSKGTQRLTYRASFRILSKILPTKIGVIRTKVGKRSWPLAVFKEHQPPRADTAERRLELLQMVQRGDFDS